jgi:hypothetical protein
MVIRFVVTDPVMVMKLMKHVQRIVLLQVNVQMDRYLIAMVQMNAGQRVGLVMAFQIVMTSSMVPI